MIPRDYQEELSDKGLEILRKHALVYLSWEERTGKTLTAILIAEKALVTNILVITKKKALDGWHNTLDNYKHTKKYTVTTYGSAHKIHADFDLVILDEAHNYISGYPKRTPTWCNIRKKTKRKPLIYISATPHAQGYQLLYNQFALSDWSPWNNYSDFYSWFRTYGIPRQIRIGSRDVNQYDKVKEPLIKACIDHLFISKTRKSLDFKHEPKDIVHYIELNEETKALYNKVLKDKVLSIGNAKLLADTTIKLRSTLHMIEGGTIKTVANDCSEVNSVQDAKLVKRVKEKVADMHLCHLYYTLSNCEKIDCIFENWGDSEDVAIMYNYIAEEYKLKEYFKNAVILQATSNAEGVELSHIRHLVVYSQDFSTARHTQRRARQASKDREHPIDVHFLLTKNGISDQIYETVSVNKRNYVDSVFERKYL